MTETACRASAIARTKSETDAPSLNMHLGDRIVKNIQTRLFT
jgi:hypothetical protein